MRTIRIYIIIISTAHRTKSISNPHIIITRSRLLSNPFTSKKLSQPMTSSPPGNDVTTMQEQVEEETPQQTTQNSYDLQSINSTILIRSIPSQGLSFQLWPAATTLLNLLDRRTTTTMHPLFTTTDHKTLRILELGSGTGLVGIAAAAILGADVTVTDLPHVLPNLKHNVDANASALKTKGGSVCVAALEWGNAEDMESVGRSEFDLIIGSDVVYHDHLYEPLLETLKFFLIGSEEEKKNVVFLMAHLKRWKKESVFFKRAKKYFDVDVIHSDSPCNGSRVGVTVYQISSRKV